MEKRLEVVLEFVALLKAVWTGEILVPVRYRLALCWGTPGLTAIISVVFR